MRRAWPQEAHLAALNAHQVEQLEVVGLSVHLEDAPPSAVAPRMLTAACC